MAALPEEPYAARGEDESEYARVDYREVQDDRVDDGPLFRGLTQLKLSRASGGVFVDAMGEKTA